MRKKLFSCCRPTPYRVSSCIHSLVCWAGSASVLEPQTNVVRGLLQARTVIVMNSKTRVVPSLFEHPSFRLLGKKPFSASVLVPLTSAVRRVLKSHTIVVTFGRILHKQRTIWADAVKRRLSKRIHSFKHHFIKQKVSNKVRKVSKSTCYHMLFVVRRKHLEGSMLNGIVRV